MKKVLGVLKVLAVLGVLGTSTLAQRGPTQPAAPAGPAEPTPRWPDGHVNLGSTPDRKGYWEVRPGLGGMPRGNDIPAQPWARAVAQFRNSKNDLYPPLVRCKPSTASP